MTTRPREPAVGGPAEQGMAHGPWPAVLPTFGGPADLETRHGVMRVWADLHMDGGIDMTILGNARQQLAPPFTWHGWIDLRLGGEILRIENQDATLHLSNGRSSIVHVGSIRLASGSPVEWQIVGRDAAPFGNPDPWLVGR